MTLVFKYWLNHQNQIIQHPCQHATQDDIKNMLNSIVRTSIDKNEAGQLTNAQLNQKVTVGVEKLNGNATLVATQNSIPWWVWVIGGILLVVIILLVFFIIRSRRQAEYEEEFYDDEEEVEVDDISEEKETETTLRRKQLEKMAKEKPDEFAKLLRTWISED